MPDIEVLRTLSEKTLGEHTAVLVIDMLNDFLSPEGKAAEIPGRTVDSGRATIEPIQRLLGAARTVGATIVHLQHTTYADGRTDTGPWLDARERAATSRTDFCLDGTWGQEFIPELAPEGDDLAIKKSRLSGFDGTHLDMVLQGRGIKTVICVGVSTNSCIESTAHGAFSSGYYVVIPSDAVASWDMELHAATLKTANARYATVCTVDEITKAWLA